MKRLIRVLALTLLLPVLLHAQKQVILTSGTTWTVPSDWSGGNTIECIGGGGAGETGSPSPTSGGGGGGGAYSKAVNVTLTPGATVTIAIGTGGTGGEPGGPGSDSY